MLRAFAHVLPIGQNTKFSKNLIGSNPHDPIPSFSPSRRKRLLPRSGLRSLGNDRGCRCRLVVAVSHIAVDLNGLTFGRWKIISRAPSDKQRNARWNVKCSCGTEAVVDGRSLTRNRSVQCRPCYDQKRPESITQRVPRQLVPQALDMSAARVFWTAEQDETLLRLRAEGASFAECGLTVGKSRTTARMRFRQLTVAVESQPIEPTSAAPVMRASPLPLPPGSSISWGAINFLGLSYPQQATP